MIFKCDFILHYVSQFMVLEPGDVVTTGTPPGVGLGMKPPTFLKAGDVMKLSIEGLGTQQQKVVPFKLLELTDPARPQLEQEARRFARRHRS